MGELHLGGSARQGRRCCSGVRAGEGEQGLRGLARSRPWTSRNARDLGKRAKGRRWGKGREVSAGVASRKASTDTRTRELRRGRSAMGEAEEKTPGGNEVICPLEGAAEEVSCTRRTHGRATKYQRERARWEIRLGRQLLEKIPGRAQRPDFFAAQGDKERRKFQWWDISKSNDISNAARVSSGGWLVAS